MAPADNTRSTTEALAAMSKTIEDLAIRNQQSIDDLSTRTQQTFIEFSTRTQAVEALVQRQGEENAKTNANVERMMKNIMNQLQGVMQEPRSGDISQHVGSSSSAQLNSSPLLPTPGTSLIDASKSKPLQIANNNIKTPRIDVPTFSGEDPEAWVFQIERFFDHNLIPEDQKLTLATFYMSGEALRWYQWLYSTHQVSNWYKIDAG